MSPVMERPLSPSEIEALIEEKLAALWKAEKPCLEAQNIRSALSVAADDSRLPQWLLDYVPDYVWRLVDIAAQRGLNAAKDGR